MGAGRKSRPPRHSSGCPSAPWKSAYVRPGDSSHSFGGACALHAVSDKVAASLRCRSAALLIVPAVRRDR
eukprot:3461104-Pleurochrysis_carterae.AAC.2